MRLKDSFHPYAGATILFWSLAYVLTRLALSYFSPTSLGFLRYAVASAALITVILAMKIKVPDKADFKWFFLSGLLGFFLYVIVFNKGCETVTAAASSVIIATVPIFTALMARLLFGEKISGIQWTATVVEFSGVIVLKQLNHSLSLTGGLMWLFLAALLLSSYNLLQRRLTRTYNGLQAAAFSILSGTIALCIFLPSSIGEMVRAPKVALIYIAVLGIVSSAAAYVTWAHALKRAKNTSVVSNYMFFTPFLTTLLGLVLAGEVPDLSTIAGGSVIMTGVLIFNFGDRILNRLFYRTNN